MPVDGQQMQEQDYQADDHYERVQNGEMQYQDEEGIENGQMQMAEGEEEESEASPDQQMLQDQMEYNQLQQLGHYMAQQDMEGDEEDEVEGQDEVEDDEGNQQ